MRSLVVSFGLALTLACSGLLACAPRLVRRPYVHVPETPEAVACDGRCSKGREICEVDGMERRAALGQTWVNMKLRDCKEQFDRCRAGCPGATVETELVERR